MKQARVVITLTTDFGTADPYVGMMKGVILGINPQASIVDITHGVRPQNIRQGAFLLGKSYRYFPKGTIHVAVVDPGVGSSRRGVALSTPRGVFVAPDNGVLSYVLKDLWEDGLPELSEGEVPVPTGCRAYQITNKSLWLQPVSATFHGRDVFAPVAAHLSRGVAVAEVGKEVESLWCLELESRQGEGGKLRGVVAHVDRFGNLITDIDAKLLKPTTGLRVEVKGSGIRGLREFYSQGEGLMALVGSYGTLEIAVRDGSAASMLGAEIEDEVIVCRE
jgi:S-adenosylmethionine hydrolase